VSDVAANEIWQDLLSMEIGMSRDIEDFRNDQDDHDVSKTDEIT
jgi:hypothetical protein